MSDFALTTTATPLKGGVNAVAGTGQLDIVAFLNAWLAAESYSFIFTDTSSGRQVLIGAGTVTGIEPLFVFVHDDKVYLLAGSTVFFSAIADPEKWNDVNGVGNGFVTLSNKLSNPEDLKAMAIYQGKAVFLARNTTLIYNIDPDPANWAINQTLSNIGTVAGKSVQSLGEMEVMMLADSGIRSLRTRETSLNAFVVDIGSPIDSIVKSALEDLDDDEKALACSVIEPGSNRYWLFLPGSDGAAGEIYVLSYFPTAEIIAWSTYDATYQVEATVNPVSGTFDADGNISFTGLTIGAPYRFTKGTNATGLVSGDESVTATGDFVPRETTATLSGTALAVWDGSLVSLTQTDFSPQNFVTYNGQVYCRDSNALYVYGGSDNATYDGAECEAEPPWMDMKAPATGKQITEIDAAMEGRWHVSIGTNPADEEDLKLIYANTGSSFFLGAVPVKRIAPFYKLRMQSKGTAYARFCSVMPHFEKVEQ